MGFLHESEPLTWAQAMSSLKYVRDHGIEQFLMIFERCNAIEGDPFRWGDEVEHQVFSLHGKPADSDRSAKVSLRSPEILAELKKVEEQLLAGGTRVEEICEWVPEYGRWMVESTPKRPYAGLVGVLDVEPQLQLRRARLRAALRPEEVAPTLTHFPLLGVGNFSEPAFAPQGPVLQSMFVPDEVVFTHPRFPTLARNIRARHGSNVGIWRPKLQDTQSAQAEHAPDFVPRSVAEADAMDRVYADAMPFGMGLSCVQVTMQAADILQSRLLYDQLAALTPVLLALTAATPFMRGWICDDDVRWGQISQSVDDRTIAERRPATSSHDGPTGDDRLAGSGNRPLSKSRYDGIDCYIGARADTVTFNDMALAMDQGHFDRLVSAGVDSVLARHVAHLFARDPLVIFADRIEIDDRHDVDHWENLQSTNWQTLRWKPPPPQKGELSKSNDSHIGWRVEFRSMEVQVTDFENAAFISFVVLLARAILDQHLDLRIPMSKLEYNMSIAGRRSAYVSEQFWFRQDLDFVHASQAKCELMTCREILNGNGSFQGLIPLCKQYICESCCDHTTRQKLERYMDFISERAAGNLPTDAKWMRDFVMSHPTYEHDGRVTQAAAYDLLAAAEAMGNGSVACRELLGSFASLEADVKQTTPTNGQKNGYPSLLTRIMGPDKKHGGHLDRAPVSLSI
eukprot:TRINITY_DN153_c0_g1_i1.p1 TRINITY_DN153_c0_g1~~TRINITY_DN153_c0_g1_i1.p1  ORF type:complete len:715 (-),score=124.81 TRINITY_DN153_c0_g1_i1:108-2153(-)